MTLQTTPADRREMVQAISERLNSPAVYLRTPTYAYRIGGLTVERDGSIDSDDEALLETLRPMLIERGWLTDAAAADSEAAADQESGEGAVVNADQKQLRQIMRRPRKTPKARIWSSASRWRTGRFRS